ncbi:hypothetical protein A4X09_0g1877 [Tilletia walkeri]|uniref:Uncharacterized protein n=1 Tax=Tilletia walkeri TaxID=117179 RepID=A0A8X7T691_9BASI|nr:hypothetical protein A4X09_0g1877 [Tilletia walkeri]
MARTGTSKKANAPQQTGSCRRQRTQAAKLAEDSNKLASDAASSACAATSKVASATSNIASAAAEAASSAAEAATKVSSKVASASRNVASAVTDAASSASDVATKASDKVLSSHLRLYRSRTHRVQSSSQSIRNRRTSQRHPQHRSAAQKVVDAASAATDTVKDSTGTKKNKSEGDIPFDSVEDVIISTNADHLLDFLTSYLGEVTPGGATAWKEQLGAQAEQAFQAGRDAISNVPNKEAAQQIALGAQKWLLEAVKFDEGKLGGGENSTEDELERQFKLAIEQKKKLYEMGKTLRKRITCREAAMKKKEKAEKKV